MPSLLLLVHSIATNGCNSVKGGLDMIVKLEKIINKSAAEIKEIWTTHNNNSGHPNSVLSSSEFDKFQKRSNTSPLFVLPLKRPIGFISYLVETQAGQSMFTSLEQYKRLGSLAPKIFTLTHYTELAAAKDLVLGRGEKYERVITGDDCQELITTMYMFYCNDALFQHVWNFNHRPAGFRWEDVMKQFSIKLEKK